MRDSPYEIKIVAYDRHATNNFTCSWKMADQAGVVLDTRTASTSGSATPAMTIALPMTAQVFAQGQHYVECSIPATYGGVASHLASILVDE